MPRPKTELTPRQREIIDEYGGWGYTSERIVALQHAELQGLGWHVIRETLRALGHVDLKRSQRTKGMKQVGPERKAEIAAFIREHGGKLPNETVAETFGVSLGIAARVRIKTIGKVGHAAPVSPERERSRRKKLVRFYATKRIRRFIAMVLARQKYSHETGFTLRVCTVCWRKWFKARDFYDFNNSLNKYEAFCKICKAEIRRLKKRGLTNEECRRVVARYSWFPAKSDYQSLVRLFEYDRKYQCADPVVPCAQCGSRWYQNQRYFHATKDESGKIVLLDVCLGCSA